MGFPDGPALKNLPAMQKTWETRIPSLGREDPLGQEGPLVSTYSSVLAWESHGQRSLASYRPENLRRVGHD